MKLFITNKQEFENQFDDFSIGILRTNEIHSKAYHQLLLSIDIDNCIPLTLTPNYDHEGIVIFDFVTKKNEVYYYSFNGTAK